MARGNWVTREVVENVIALSERYPEMSNREMAHITGWASKSTISAILRGEYDHLLEKEIYQEDIVNDEKCIHEINSKLSKLMILIEKNNRLLSDLVDAFK